MKQRMWIRSLSVLMISRSRRNSSTMAATLETMNFDNLTLRSLPLDNEQANYTRQVAGACFSRVTPTPVKNPKTVAYSAKAMELLDISEKECKRGDFAKYMAGNVLFPGSETAAHCYCGHQFGYFSGQLGDGATMFAYFDYRLPLRHRLNVRSYRYVTGYGAGPENFDGRKLVPPVDRGGHIIGFTDYQRRYVGEVVNAKGERWELQFKGAGKTPYSRSADGRKVLRSSVREFLCSEVMHNLNVPTTRSGSCVTSDSYVTRDMFYTGNNIQERCTIISRIAPTFIRFGSFEICRPTDRETGRKGPSHGRKDILAQLTNFVIKTYYPAIWDRFHADQQTLYLEFFREVCLKTARLVARWQCVGFCHGVLNTDNMSIVGLTIDYGPYGFLDRYDPDFICNSSDDGGRYTYAKQPEICRWNCGKLAESLEPLIPLSKTNPLLKDYDEEYDREYWKIMRKKFGLIKNLSADKGLMQEFLDTMYKSGADFTNCFRILSHLHSEADLPSVLIYLMDQCCSAQQYKKAFSPSMDPSQLRMLLMLQAQNPEILSMLGKKAGALQREMELMEKAEELKSLNPSKKQENDRKLWSVWLQKYMTRVAAEYENGLENRQIRITTMNKSNPRIVLRNFIAQNAIDLAEKGDYSEVRRVMKAFEDPFDESIRYSDLTAYDEAVEGKQGNMAEVDDDMKSDNPSCSRPKKKCKVEYDMKPPEEAHIRVS